MQTPSLVDRVMNMLRAPATAGADALSPRPAGFGRVLRPFAGLRGSGRLAAPETPRPATVAPRPGRTA
jgi:hypothetical protein